LQMLPGGPPIVGQGQSAVAAEHEVLRVARIDPQSVVVGVDAGGAVVAKTPAAVAGNMQGDAEHIDAPLIGRIDPTLAEVERPRAKVVYLCPGVTPVFGAKNPARVDRARGSGLLAVDGANVGLVGLDDGVDNARIAAGNGQAAAAERPVGQAVMQAQPGLAAI